MILINDTLLIDYGLTNTGFNPVKELWYIQEDLYPLATAFNQNLVLN